MSSHFYFAATLPALQATASTPPLSHAAFMEQASRFLSARDLAVLDGARLFMPEDGSFPVSVSSSPLLARYYRWELALRNELARLRAGRLQKPVDKHLRPGEPEWDGVKAAQAAFQADDPLQGELLIERERWSLVETLAVNKFFNMEYLIAYSLHVQILERRARFDLQRGQEGYRTVYRSVLDTADYRDESGETK